VAGRRPADDTAAACLSAVEVAEHLADGRAGPAELGAARAALVRAHAADPGGVDRMNPAYDARCRAGHILDLAAGQSRLLDIRGALLEDHPFPDGREAAEIIRDIFGNPFRSVTAEPSWLTSTVVSLAEGIYADRAVDRLPILADALQDAGCADPDVLAHCRGPGPHVRGCWVVDLLLGKE
jgi:hypothetical protein